MEQVFIVVLLIMILSVMAGEDSKSSFTSRLFTGLLKVIGLAGVIYTVFRFRTEIMTAAMQILGAFGISFG